MVKTRVGPIGLTDTLYGGGIALAATVDAPGMGVRALMAVLALLALLVDWQRARATEPWVTSSLQGVVSLVMFSLPVVGVWVALATRSPERLELFFALLAAFFFLTALRDAALLELTPVELLLEGYASLVAIYLVLGATADALSEYEGVLVVIALSVFVIRNLFHWTDTVLSLLSGDSASQS